MSIEEAIRAGEEEVVRALQGAPESVRRAAAPSALGLYAAWRSEPYGPNKELGGPAGLAVLGTANLTELRKARLYHVSNERLGLEILRDRQPDWLGAWVSWTLDRQPYSHLWRFARALEQAGLIARPAGASYWLGMIVGSGRRGVLPWLEADPTLLADVWQLFEVEGNGEFSLAAHDKYMPEEGTWAFALRSLSHQGKLDRQRLLDASLQALARDFEQFRAGWFSRFHESLQPDLSERGSRVENYVGLLGSRIGPTVSFALRALSGLEVELAEPLAPALTAREKGTALAALKLLATSKSSRVPLVAAEGLGHAAAEVQKAAWELIASRGSLQDDELRRAVQDRVEGLSATLAPRVRSWLGQTAPAVPTPTQAAPPVAPPAAVLPVVGLDELLELLARLLETGEPALDLERAMDGVSRFCAEKPGRAAAPLVKRARQVLQRAKSKSQNEMARLALAWLAGETTARQVDDSDQAPSAFFFLSARMDELCQSVLESRAAPLAALPATAEGRIALVQGAIGPLDLAQTLLRLSPEPTLSPELSGELLDAARFATGHPAPVGSNPALWAAAARARAPFSDCPEVEARHPGLGRAYSCDLRIVERHKHLWVDRHGDHELLARRTLPTNLIWGWSGHDTPADRRWQALIWPNGRPAWWAQGWLALGNNLDWWEADWADVVYLESLLEPVALEQHGRRLLAMGLAAKEPGQVGMAVDALASALAQGRVEPGELAQTFAELTELVKPARWARSLSETARLSEALASQVYDLLERYLGLAPPAGELVELLMELGARLGRSLLDPEARSALSGLKGSGKASRAARTALAQ